MVHSRVGNSVGERRLNLVPLHFLLVGSAEVIRHGCGGDRVSVGGVLLRAVFDGNHLEVFESIGICSRHLELGRHVSCHGQLFSC